MAVVYIQEFPIADRSTTNYDFVAEKIGDGPFEGRAPLVLAFQASIAKEPRGAVHDERLTSASPRLAEEAPPLALLGRLDGPGDLFVQHVVSIQESRSLQPARRAGVYVRTSRAREALFVPSRVPKRFWSVADSCPT